MFEPNAVVLYVNNVAITSKFYQDLMGAKPSEESPTFHSFSLSNGMSLGLKAKHSVEPPAEGNGNSELAFVVHSDSRVDELFSEWQQKQIKILQQPTSLPYGYTFVGLDPDDNRLRVVSLRKS